MKPHLILAGVLAIGAGSVPAQELYRWVDRSGTVHYGDLPESGAAQIEQKKFQIDPLPEYADLPYETRLAHERFPITLYVSDNCGDLCIEARFFLEKRGIPFTEKNLVAQEDMDTFKQQSGGDVVPALAIGKGWLRGYSAIFWDKELDIAGYPRTAPLRP